MLEKIYSLKSIQQEEEGEKKDKWAQAILHIQPKVSVGSCPAGSAV